MTTLEFKDEFLTKFDSMSTNSAPGLDDYIISLYLTEAQEELVKAAFDPRHNTIKRGFEQIDMKRKQLQHLIKQLVRAPIQAMPFSSNRNLHINSLIYMLNVNIFITVAEFIEIKDPICDDPTIVPVVPILHDAFTELARDPFSQPNGLRAWRLDSGTAGNFENVEIVSKKSYLRYVIRFIEKPKPIIVGDISNLNNQSYTIDGFSSPSTSQLNSVVHRDIVNRAVTNAVFALDPERAPLQTFNENKLI